MLFTIISDNERNIHKLPFSPTSTKLMVGGMFGNNDAVNATCTSLSDDNVDTADIGLLRAVVGRDLVGDG